MILAQRENLGIFGAQVWSSATGSFTGEERRLDDLIRFAARGTLSGDINTSAGLVGFTLDKVEGHPNGSYTDDEQEADEALLLVGNELISLGSQYTQSEATYSYFVSRGRLGTVADSHSMGDEVWFFRKSDLQRYQMPLNGEFTPSNYTVYLKLLAMTPLELGSATAAFSVVSAGASLPLPDITLSIPYRGYYRLMANWSSSGFGENTWFLLTYWKDGEYHSTKDVKWVRASEELIDWTVPWHGTTWVIAQTIAEYDGIQIWGTGQTTQQSINVRDWPVPDAPTITSMTFDEAHQRITVEWTDPTVAGGLRDLAIWGRKGTSGEYTYLGSIQAGIGKFIWERTLQDDTDTSWMVQMRAYGASGRESAIAEDSVTVPGVEAPNSFNVISLTAGRALEMEWTPRSDEQWIVIQILNTDDIKSSPDLIWVREGTTSNTKHRVTGLEPSPGANYYVRAWRVKEWLSERLWSGEVTDGTGWHQVYSHPAPGEVTGLTVSNEHGHVRLSWTNPTEDYFEKIEIHRRQSYDWSGGQPNTASDSYSLLATVMPSGTDGYYEDPVRPVFNEAFAYRVRTVARYGDARSSGVESNPSGGHTPKLPMPHLSFSRTSTAVVGKSGTLLGMDGSVPDYTPVTFEGESLPAPLQRGKVYYLTYWFGSTTRYHKVFDSPLMQDANEIAITTTGSGLRLKLRWRIPGECRGVADPGWCAGAVWGKWGPDPEHHRGTTVLGEAASGTLL